MECKNQNWFYTVIQKQTESKPGADRKPLLLSTPVFFVSNEHSVHCVQITVLFSNYL